MESLFHSGNRQFYAQNTKDVHIWDHSLPVLGDESSSTEVNDEPRRQELEPEQTQEQQQEEQEHKKSKSKKSGQGQEEQYYE